MRLYCYDMGARLVLGHAPTPQSREHFHTPFLQGVAGTLFSQVDMHIR